MIIFPPQWSPNPTTQSLGPDGNGSWRTAWSEQRTCRWTFLEHIQSSSNHFHSNFPFGGRSTLCPKFSHLSVPKSLLLTTKLLVKCNCICQGEGILPDTLTACHHKLQAAVKMLSALYICMVPVLVFCAERGYQCYN